MTRRKPVILGIGEIVWDCLPGGMKLGGAPVNFAYHVMQLGADSYPVSAVGTDELGNETLESCRRYGLETRFIQRNSLPTSRVLVNLDGNGVPQYNIVENVAWDALEATPEALSFASRADAVCWGSLSQRCATSRKAIWRILCAVPETAMKIFDINLRQHYFSKEIIEDSLRQATVLKLNEDELPLVLSLLGISDIGKLVTEFELDNIVFTHGADYSEVYGPEGLLSHIETPKVKVSDTVGAGDCFTAAFATSLLNGEPIVTAHEKAVRLSAWLCTLPGAINPHQL
ncbi:MAG: carbohydrate kinase [Bacteroidales bacterium]|nr:carbohydrate kinase [Bacteroidales bacterium]